MLQISPFYSDFLNRRSRTWLIKVDIDGVEYDASRIVDLNIDNEIADGYDGFTIGTINISTCTLRLRTPDPIAPNARVVPYIALSLADMTLDTADYAWDDADFAWDGSGTTEWLPLGVFYVDNRKRINNIIALECLDGLVYADVAYVSQLTYPTTMQAVWDEVCAQAGLIYDGTVQIDPSHVLNAGPAGYTCRQVMSFIAGVHGASVKMSRTGEVSWRTYRADEHPVHELTTSDYIRVKQTNPVKTYTRVVVTYDEDDQLAYEAGEGDDNHTLYMTNPLMSQAMVDALHAQINGFSYVPIEMDARGYPQMEHGDRIIYQQVDSTAWIDTGMTWDDADFAWDGLQTYQTLILRQTFTFKGGLGMTIAAPSISEQESEFGIDGTLTAAVNRLSQNAVRYGKTYYGVTHSRTEGIVVQREDGTAKAVFNADELSFYADGERALWFDIPNKRFKFTGTLEGADGIFSGTVQAGTIDASTINGGSISGSTIMGGTIVSAFISGGVISGGSINIGSGQFAVDSSGFMTATGAYLSGGSITGAANINVTNDVKIGQKLILPANDFRNGIYWGVGSVFDSFQIYIDPGGGAMFLIAPNGIYANGVRIDV